MARTLADATIGTRSARQKLARRSEPYWRAMSDGLAIGYRKGVKGGTWVARHYSRETGRQFEALGTADDVVDADGVMVFDFNRAQAAARKWFAALVHPVLAPYTVKKCMEDYLTYMIAHRKGARDARSRISAHIVPKLGEIDCAKLTKRDVEAWLHTLASAPAQSHGGKQRPLDRDDPEAIRRRKASANRTLTTLKAGLNRAFKDAPPKIASDASWRHVERFKAVDASRVGYLTVAEAQRLMNACPADFRRLVQAALATGARYGELSQLMAGDFNLDSGTIQVRVAKSDKPRHIILTAEGITLFKTLAAGKAKDALLLTKASGEPWKMSDQDRRMRNACAAAQIVPAIGIHGLRHTWASLAVMRGVPLMVVAQNLGHSDVTMVQKFYGHLSNDYVVQQIRSGAPVFGIEADQKVIALR
jgi:integrase